MLALPAEVSRAFFARFGGHLTPIQEIAFARFEPCRDALVIAPTGSGKTEAAFVPLACALQARKRLGQTGLLALVVSPTRALASDLHRRMAAPLGKLGLCLDVATSDRDTRRASRQCDILIRTPEGLDVSLCHRPETLGTLSEVVIDEIHQYNQNPRGTQLAGLLHRLSDLIPGHRRSGISATLPESTGPERLRLLRNPIIAQTPPAGDLSLTIHHWTGRGREGVPHFLRSLRELGARKCIAFARSRARVEEVAALLDAEWLRGKCLVHHGSLSSTLRRQTEDRLKRLKTGIVVATTPWNWASTSAISIPASSLMCPLTTSPSCKELVGWAGGAGSAEL
jgi:ATP-dependent helicase Lhr and Lhr-like helicase